MGYETLTLETDDDGIATLAVNRPDKLNALNQDVLAELSRAMKELARDRPRGLLLRGAGEKAFVAGADIRWMSGLTAQEAMTFSRMGQEAFLRIEDAPFPVVAAVRGFALGGGLELAMAADLIVAGAGAKLGQPEASLGLVPGFLGSHRLPRLVGPARAKELLMTGRMIDADEALRIGLVARVVADAEVFTAARETLQKAARNAPLAVAAVKRLVDDGAHLDRRSAGSLEAETFGRMFATMDHDEGIEAFLGKRKPAFRGE